MSQEQHKRRAIVIGGSMAGLLAARVLAEQFDEVLIVDRDRFPDTPEHRAGVPQSQHAHALLPRGQEIIEQLFPGLMNELKAAGAHVTYDAVPVAIISPAGKLPELRQPGETLAFSRYLLEWHVRHRLVKDHGVQLLPGHEVLGLEANDEQVTGVRVRERQGASEPQLLAAALVVDASGRGSKALSWLADLGYGTVPEETITTDLGYASRFYRRPANFSASWEALIVNVCPPDNPRAGLILPVDGDRWHVTLGGVAGHHPATDEASFLDWARQLADPCLYEALRDAEPLTPIRGYRTPENRLRHYERLARWPVGLIVTGDSVCAFNPIYGQGMTVSALDALVLQRCLREQQARPRPRWEQRFQRELARNVATPWANATGEDLRWSKVKITGATPSPMLKLRHGLMDLVLAEAVENAAVAQAYTDVIFMTRGPEAIMQPAVLLRVLGGALRRAVGGGRNTKRVAATTGQ